MKRISEGQKDIKDSILFDIDRMLSEELAHTFAEFVEKVTQDHQLLKLTYELTVAKDPTGLKK